jgi:hypothetical protein
VIYDLKTNTPEAGVMKVGWALVVLYTGFIGLFFYFMTCREPMKGTHEEFIRPLWKQATGSEVHYLARFLSGLFIFQALSKRKMMGGTYFKALKNSFYPDWVSMSYIIAGIIPAMVIWGSLGPISKSPLSLHFWIK